MFLDGEDKLPRLKGEGAQGWTLNSLANSYSLSGQPRRSIPVFQNALLLAEKMDDKNNIAIGLDNVADDQLKIGMLIDAERNLRKMMSLAKETEDEFRQARCHLDLGRFLSYRGAWQEAEQELSIAEKVFDKYGAEQTNFVSVVRTYRALRFLLLAKDNPKTQTENLKSAIECAQRALELAGETTKTWQPFPRDYVRTYWLLGAAYRANIELTLAEENLSKALSLCRQINMVDHEADILLDVARLRYAQGDFKDAQEKASEALVITERSGYVLQGADVNLFLAELALTLDPSPEGRGKARAHAEEALKLAYCDGGEYKYKVAYEEAEAMLKKL